MNLMKIILKKNKRKYLDKLKNFSLFLYMYILIENKFNIISLII